MTKEQDLICSLPLLLHGCLFFWTTRTKPLPPNLAIGKRAYCYLCPGLLSTAELAMALEKSGPKAELYVEVIIQHFDSASSTLTVEDVAPKNDNYASLKVPQLRAELERRGLPTEGTRQTLLARLQSSSPELDQDEPRFTASLAQLVPKMLRSRGQNSQPFVVGDRVFAKQNPNDTVLYPGRLTQTFTIGQRTSPLIELLDLESPTGYGEPFAVKPADVVFLDPPPK